MRFAQDCLNGCMDEEDLEEVDRDISGESKAWTALTFDVVEVEVDHIRKVVKFFDVLNADVSDKVTFDEYFEMRRARGGIC